MSGGALIRIRLAAEADLAAIVGIYNEAIPGRLATADTEAVSVESRLDWFRKHEPSSYPIFVGEDEGGDIVGWQSLSPFYGRPAYRKTVESSTYIKEGRQGRGIGKLLLGHALGISPSLGIQTVLGFVFAHNGPSLRLCEDLGFEKWGHLPRVAELDGVERDLVIVGKRVFVSFV